jgi:hypothetical protein
MHLTPAGGGRSMQQKYIAIYVICNLGDASVSVRLGDASVCVR